MTLTSLKKNKYVYVTFFYMLLWGACLQFVSAQTDSVSLSVTPTLFEMAAEPLQVWNSNVKVINNNRYPLTVYMSVTNFAPQGETGQGKFLPVFEDVTDGSTLAEWIEITDQPVVLGPGESKQVPFSVRVPEDATPGGHFAAIMVGTRPPDSDASFQIKTSQIVTSLFFVRIAGDVIENGVVREFTTSKSFYQEPNATFEVRFENKGNVHIQPQGEIVITNMWGKERGTIPINHKTHFGNVLPESIRKFEFTWKGEPSFSDIGRYTAVLTLAYGSDNRKFVTSKTFFWVIPVKPLLTVVGTFVLIVLFILWAVRAYVRKMLEVQGYQPDQPKARFIREGDVLIERRKKIDAPVKAGWSDLRTRLQKTKAFLDTLKALMDFIWAYRIFFGALLAFLIAATLIWLFVGSVLKDSRDYEITIENPDTDVTLSSEEILYEKQKESAPVTADKIDEELATTTPEQDFELIIVNSSDTTGQAAAMQRQLESKYEVSSLQSDFGESKERSVIVYHKDLQEEALALRTELGDFILSALPPGTEDRTITIYIGNDFVAP